MTQFLSNDAWTGIAAIVSVLTFVVYILAEWKKIYDGSKELSHKGKELTQKVFPEGVAEASNKLLDSFLDAIGV